MSWRKFWQEVAYFSVKLHFFYFCHVAVQQMTYLTCSENKTKACNKTVKSEDSLQQTRVRVRVIVLQQTRVRVRVIVLQQTRVRVRVIVLNATFNNISVISWRSVNRRNPPTCCKSLIG